MKTMKFAVLFAVAGLMSAVAYADEAKTDAGASTTVVADEAPAAEKPAKDEKKADKKDEKAGEKAKGKAKPYPLDTCIVTDNKLGSMGDPVSFVHEGQEIKVCCAPCEKKFKKDPALYLKKLEEAK